MIVMIFEYWLDEEHQEEYLQHAAVLRQLVQSIDGFISIERFRSESDPDKILALGYFRDEEAVKRWRNVPAHRQAQLLGRDRLFTDYHLCIAEASRDYTKQNRAEVPEDSLRLQG
jgi:heme-degrading monooxygenase HmoA